MDDATAVLITVTGRDRPGVTTAWCEALDKLDAHIHDVEQVVIRDRLVLGLLVSLGVDLEPARAALDKLAEKLGLDVEVEQVAARRPTTTPIRHYVTVLGQPLTAAALTGVTGQITACGGNIDRITRLSRYPITSFELLVSGGDGATLRQALSTEAAARHVDVAIQRATLYRRAKRLVVLDVDSTLLQAEVIDLVAEQAGRRDEVAAITAAAMTGELEFAESLRQRVALLAGVPETVLEDVCRNLPLTPGAATLVRTLKRLGFTTAAVSGGFTHVTDVLRDHLGLDYTHANTLEVVDGRLTGRLIGEVVDRETKAHSLERFAAAEGIPLSQTVAVGDGANDLDMLACAGLGIAFNAKPVVQEAADTAVSVPYLDAILFLLGITREEIEAADAEDPAPTSAPPVAVPE